MLAIIGAGSYGTALAQAFASSGQDILLWDRSQERIDELKRTRINAPFHSNIVLHPQIQFESNLNKVFSASSTLILSIPSYACADFLIDHQTDILKVYAVVCTAKGLLTDTVQTLSQRGNEVFGRPWMLDHYFVLSGPSFAHDVVRGLFTALTIAGGNHEKMQHLQRSMHASHLHVYGSDDVIGVELAGALKNVVAIAAGAMDEKGFGLNARAALLTRALAEIRRIGVAMGANPLTFSGLSGMGDLILTCTGDYSRNRMVGKRLAEGRTLKEVLKELGQVAEGIRTTKAACKLAKRVNVRTPILEAVYKVLYESKDLMRELETLLSQEPESE